MGLAMSRISEDSNVIDGSLRWYRDERLKNDLGYGSPMQYRRDLELIA